MTGRDLPFEEDARPPAGEPALIVDVEGFEGPLDLLLTLARNQKVDLARISILALVEQYMAFVEEARKLRLELAADYLVMAAWLAFLKSRLLLPPPEKAGDEPSGEEMAGMLAFRLRRLEAMREAAARLVNRDRLGRDVFARGAPEPVAVSADVRWQASLYDLLAAYATQRQRQMVTRVHVARRTVWSLADAREILTRLVGRLADWVPLEEFLSPYLADPQTLATVRASAFTASLELAREGRLELRQSGAFAPLYLRSGTPRAADPVGEGRGNGKDSDKEGKA
ncbi:segregation and condensation protein A [Methylobrevis pamukkalensis]|uniref:Segregation and condensation protein A n=1 Tax=Methylobrevis pamukkalensis TaxID=1439726 RepID=A0A1E3GYX3_9HYPH|nr:ScpA family protein [Methylobrevis pamukkalensis]ODN69260.1 Segregation and condensation protein A [Methylobrevis pamukkalensis]